MASFEEKYRELQKKREPEKKSSTKESGTAQTVGGGFAKQYMALKKKREDSPAGLPSYAMQKPAVTGPRTLSEAIAEQWKAQAKDKKAETTSAPVQTEQAVGSYRGPEWAQEMAERYKPETRENVQMSPVAQWEAQKRREAAGGGPEAKDWDGLAGNTLMAGVGQVSKASSSLFSAAEQLVSRPLGWLLGNPELYKDAPFYQLDKAVDRDVAAIQEDLAGSAERTGKAGELIAKFGPATVAALPQAALAYLTAGQSLAAQTSTAGLQAASTAAQLTGGAAAANTVLQAVKGMAANPSFQYSFLNTVGGEYQQALEDGADAPTAYAYAALSSLANSLVEVGGGIDTLPETIRGKNKGQLLEWVKSMFDEGKEEVVQGVIYQMMQNGVYQKGNPLFSMTDENAVVNPGRMAEEFAGGAVVGGVLGGGQMAVNAAIDSAARRAAQNALQAQASPGDNQIPAEVQTEAEARENGDAAHSSPVEETTITTAAPAEPAAATSQSAEQMTGRLVRMGEQAETAARIGELLGRVKDGQTLTEAELNEVRSNPGGAKLIDAVQGIADRRAAEDTTGGQQNAGEQKAGEPGIAAEQYGLHTGTDTIRTEEQLGEASVPDGQKERGIGADSGGPAGAVSESAGGWNAEGQRGGAAEDDGKIPVSVREETIPDRASGTQSLRAIARQNAVTESGAEMVSTKNYMGLDIGSDRPSLFDAPEEVIRSDKVLSEVYDTIWEEGYRPHMFTGSPELADANLVFDGAVNGEDVYIRIDQGRYDADAIWEHERFHILSAEDPGLRSSVRDALLQQYDQAELMKIMETYLEKYRGAYGMETVQGLWDLSEADMDLILEELLADAYAGKDTFRAGTGKYRDTVREVASRREEQGYRTGGAPEAARFDVGYSQDGRSTNGTEEPAGLSLPTLEDGGKKAKPPAKEDTGQRAAPADRRKAASRKLADDLAEIFPETSRKYLRDLADEVRGGAEQEQLDALFNEAYDSARVYDESPEAAELREIARELRGRRVYVDESVREAFEDDWKNVRSFFMGKGLYFTGDRNDIGLDVLNGELASRFGGRFNESETDLENVISRLEYVLRAGVAKQISLDEQARQYGGEEAVQKFREAYRQRFMDAAEGYRDTMSGIAEDQRAAREDARRRQRQELEDYLEEARRTLRDRASQGKETGRTDPRTHVPEGMTIDEYVQSLEQRAAQAREERLRDLQREDFRGSEAMEKLGVKISGAVTEDYQNAPELRRRQEAAEKARRAVRRAEKRMNATEAEKEFASGITSGIYTESDIPRTMDADRVMELADYYMGERAFGFDMLRQRKADISRAQQEKAKEIFGPALEAGEGKRKLAGGVMGALGDAFALNNRTAERNMRAIFGDEAGDRINRWLFAPVAENEGERYRFVNRMLDQVREIEGADGKKRKLTKAESALVQKTIEGRVAAEAVASMEMGESIQNAAKKLNEGGDMKDVAREFRLDEENRRLARQYAMWLETQEEIKRADSVKIDNAAKLYSDLYGQFYEAINDFLAVHGYEPIGFIKGYAPHMQSKETVGALNRAFQSMGLGADAGGLPTAIAGLTKDFKPGKRWSPFFQTRRGEATDYDITEGFERYVDHLSDVLYHTDDITRIREANKFLRKMYDQEEINERISQARELRYRTTKEKRDFLVDQGELDPRKTLTADEIEKRMDEYSDRLYENVRNTSRYGQLAVWMDDYANMLAGKQVFADRDMERSFGRTSLNLGNKLTRAFTRAQVSGNLSSVLNQTSQLPLIQAEVGDKYLRHAMLDMVTGGLRKGDWALKSDFLAEKNGIDYITTSPSDMIVGAMFKPMGFVDGFLSTLAVRGRYLKEIDAGRSETEAMRIADRYGREVMGSRAKGSAPLAFQSKNIFNRMLHAFQLEALNTWEHISQDLPRDYRAIAKDKGKNAAARALAGTALKILVGNFLINRASEMLYGGTPAQGDVFGIIGNFVASGAGTTLNAVTISALKKLINAGWEKVMGEKLFDDDDNEDEEERPFDLAEAAKSAGSDMLNDTPLAKNAGALFGIGDLSLPMPDLVKGVQRTADAAKEDGLFSYEVMRQLMGLAGDVVPGGRQAEKTFQGLDTALRGGRYSGYGEKEKLMYPVDEDPFTALRAALFGNSALEETGEYYASGNKALSEEQTKVYKEAVTAGGGRKEIYNAILDWRNVKGDGELTSEEKARLGEEIVGETDLSDREKLKFYKGLTGADSRAEKLEALLNAGMDWDGAIGAYAMYDEIKRREGMTAGEKATAFARWADETYPAKQAGAVREQFVYYSMVPAQAGRYDKLTDAGLGTDTAYRLSEILGALEPETGKNQVSNMQKYQAIVSAGLSESDQLKAMEAVMSEGEYAKVRAGYEQGVTPELYVKAREAAAGYDENGNGSISQDEAKQAIKAMDGLTGEQRAALWQIQNKSWKPDKNPFNKKVGREVYQELNREEPEEDEESTSQLPGLSLPSLR